MAFILPQSIFLWLLKVRSIEPTETEIKESITGLSKDGRDCKEAEENPISFDRHPRGSQGSIGPGP
jgi:hypothetical protein